MPKRGTSAILRKARSAGSTGVITCIRLNLLSRESVVFVCCRAQAFYSKCLFAEHPVLWLHPRQVRGLCQLADMVEVLRRERVWRMLDNVVVLHQLLQYLISRELVALCGKSIQIVDGLLNLIWCHGAEVDAWATVAT